MSRFLTEPIREKHTANGQVNNFIVGRSSMQGWRDTMEDAHLEVMKINDLPESSVFGVFDGHGGSLISEEISKVLLPTILLTDEFRKDKSVNGLARAICKGFLIADKKMKEKPEINHHADEVGSTGLFSMITKDHIIVANVGDSRAILSSNNRVIALSVDHKPTVESEKLRIEAAGGSVFRGRVCGGVGVSRSFGDYWFKRNTELKDHQQQVTAEPTIHVHKRTEGDEFMVLACDGIYDVLANEQVQKFISDKLQAGYKNPGTICELLLDECLARGSRDNMSVILIVFEGASRFNRKNSCMVQ